jgi:hypothetical protein
MPSYLRILALNVLKIQTAYSSQGRISHIRPCSNGLRK